MAKQATEIEYTESSFKLNEFSHTILDITVKFEVLKMKDSCFIWIGDNSNPLFSDLSFGIKSLYSPYPVATKILGTASTDTTSLTIAEKLCKKLKKPVYLSFNVPITSNYLLEEVEKRLNEEIEINCEIF
ncbi:hypothetical protein PGB90_001757 [Kerria lacca]